MGAALKLVAAVDFGAAKRAEDEAAEALADAPAWLAAAVSADVEAVIGLGASVSGRAAGGPGDEEAVAVAGAVVSPPEFGDASAAVGRASLSAFSEGDDKACTLAAAANA